MQEEKVNKEESLKKVLDMLNQISNERHEIKKILEDIRALLRYGNDGKKNG